MRSEILDTSSMKRYTKQINTLILVLLWSAGVVGQVTSTVASQKYGSKKMLKVQEYADSLYAQAAFMESAKQYEDLEYNAVIDNEAKARLAESYRCNAEYDKAEYWYKQYVKDDADATTCLNFAKVLQANDKCEEASKWYKRYLTFNPKDAEDIEVLADCDNLKAISFNEDVIFYNLEELNTPASEYSMIELEDQLLFTSDRQLNKVAKHEDLWTNGEFSDLFVVSPDDFGTYSRPSRIKGKVNRRFHDGVAFFDNNEYRLYFTRNEKKPNKAKLRELKLYTAKISEDGTWYDVEKMALNVPGFSSCHPTLSSDGKTLIFSSNRPGGIGGMDLYYSTKVKDEWTTPVHMGSEINSVSNEIFPHLASDGGLFFASNGHVGLGGLDIFRVKLDPHKFSNEDDFEVQNIGRPFNSTKDDFSFMSTDNGKSGYLASNREGGKGKDDLYRWILNSDDPLVLDFYKKSLCIDEVFEQEEILSANISVLEFSTITNFAYDQKETGLLSGLDEYTMGLVANIVSMKNAQLIHKQTFLSNDAAFEHIRMKPNRDYLFIAEKDGFFTSHKFVSSRENESDYLNCIELSLEPYRKLIGKVTIVENPEERGPAFIDLYNHCSKKMEKIPVAMDGSFSHKLKCLCEYELSVDHRDYEYFKHYIEAFESSCRDEVTSVDIDLKSTNPFVGNIEEGAVITLNDIFYEYDEFELSSTAQIELDHLIGTMRKHPTMKVKLTAHTDSRGQSQYNLSLSEKRVQAAVQYLIRAGIESSRLTSVGMGESQLINHCEDGIECTEEQHRANRRTEVHVTSL